MKIDVLDHGYVELIETWGTSKDGKAWDHPEHPNRYDAEIGIIEAARQSTQGSFRGWSTDSILLRHLYEHKHATPFEFAGMIIEVQAPIFVFREWHRHRTQSYSEASARYSPLPDLYYLPTEENVEKRVYEAYKTKNKQAGSMATLPTYNCKVWLERVSNFYQIAEAHYQNALADGIPKELARLVMPVGHYSKMRASANLRNWLAFLTLRMDHNAQWEIRQYANAVHSIMQQCFPQTMCLFDNERIGIPDGV